MEGELGEDWRIVSPSSTPLPPPRPAPPAPTLPPSAESTSFPTLPPPPPPSYQHRPAPLATSSASTSFPTPHCPPPPSPQNHPAPTALHPSLTSASTSFPTLPPPPPNAPTSHTFPSTAIPSKPTPYCAYKTSSIPPSLTCNSAQTPIVSVLTSPSVSLSQASLAPHIPEHSYPTHSTPPSNPSKKSFNLPWPLTPFDPVTTATGAPYDSFRGAPARSNPSREEEKNKATTEKNGHNLQWHISLANSDNVPEKRTNFQVVDKESDKVSDVVRLNVKEKGKSDIYIEEEEEKRKELETSCQLTPLKHVTFGK